MSKDLAATRTPAYHLSPQSAVALLGPIEASLAELETRLAHYVERISMPDGDREAIAKARAVLSRDRAAITELLKAERPD